MEKAFLKEEVQKYLEEHKIQIFLTNYINEIIKKLPSNPYKYMTEYMEKDLKKKMIIKKIEIKKFINKNFEEKIKGIFQIETNTINRKIEIDLEGPFLKLDLRNCENFLKKKNSENFENEKILEIERRFKDFFENQNVYEYGSFENLMERFYENENNKNFRNIILNFFFFHFKITSELRNISFGKYLKENRFFINRPNIDYEKKYFIKIFQNGKNFGTKNIFFKNIYIVLKKYKKVNLKKKKKNEQETTEYKKTNFYKDLKTAYNSLKECFIKNNKNENILKNGSFLPISENLRDNLKLTNDFISKFSEKEEIKICIDFQNNSIYNKKTEKYDYGGKLINDEEIENTIFKLISENKKIEYIIDPFEISRNFSYHKFYKKIKGKFDLKIGSKFLENFEIENFKKLDRNFFPKFKDEQFEEFCLDLFDFNFFVIDFERNFVFSKIFDKLKFLKKFEYGIFLENLDNLSLDFSHLFSEEVGGYMMGGLLDNSIRAVLD